MPRPRFHVFSKGAGTRTKHELAAVNQSNARISTTGPAEPQIKSPQKRRIRRMCVCFFVKLYFHCTKNMPFEKKPDKNLGCTICTRLRDYSYYTVHISFDAARSVVSKLRRSLFFVCAGRIIEKGRGGDKQGSTSQVEASTCQTRLQHSPRNPLPNSFPNFLNSFSNSLPNSLPNSFPNSPPNSFKTLPPILPQILPNPSPNPSPKSFPQILPQILPKFYFLTKNN